jgi:hypothetical protein
MEMHRVLLRLPRDLHQEISDAAYAARRSVNSEILWRLSQPRLVREEDVVVVPGEGPVERMMPARAFRPDFKGGKR